jgi:hypothetical protein
MIDVQLTTLQIACQTSKVEFAKNCKVGWQSKLREGLI